MTIDNLFCCIMSRLEKRKNVCCLCHAIFVNLIKNKGMEKNDGNIRDGFSSKFGVIAAAAGSAVGLGNFWRFPYVLGENGGAAFLLVYIFFVFCIGIPVLMSEF